MAVYFVTGKLGSGKTLACIGKLRDYALAGRRIAGNLDLNLDNLMHPKSKVSYTRVPDKPRIEDLEALGLGSEDYDESTFGALVLDECGTWFNARNWNDKARKPIMDWFRHARKHGWDLYFLVQDISNVDSQARTSLCEHLVVCRRLDRLPVPGLRLLSRLLGVKIMLPKIHVASVYYGDCPSSSMKVDRWVYRGRDFYEAYDTRQCFTDGLEDMGQSELTDMRATYTVLPPFVTNGYAYVENIVRIVEQRAKGEVAQVIPLHGKMRPSAELKPNNPRCGGGSADISTASGGLKLVTGN